MFSWLGELVPVFCLVKLDLVSLQGSAVPSSIFWGSKGRETGDQIANICWIIKIATEFQKNIYFCFIDCVDHNKLWKILQEVGIPDHLTCLWSMSRLYIVTLLI